MRRVKGTAGVALAGVADKRFLSSPSWSSCRMRKRSIRPAAQDARPSLNIKIFYVTPRLQYFVAARHSLPCPSREGFRTFALRWPSHGDGLEASAFSPLWASSALPPLFSPPGSGGMRRDRIRPASSAGKTPGVFRCGLGPLAPPADQLDVKHGRRFARAPARSRGRITQIFANGFEADLWGVGGHEVKQS